MILRLKFHHLTYFVCLNLSLFLLTLAPQHNLFFVFLIVLKHEWLKDRLGARIKYLLKFSLHGLVACDVTKIVYRVLHTVKKACSLEKPLSNSLLRVRLIQYFHMRLLASKLHCLNRVSLLVPLLSQKQPHHSFWLEEPDWPARLMLENYSYLQLKFHLIAY